MVPAPTFSVVIPLFNKQSTILRAVSSVFAQSVSDVEVIVVDDGSTDASVAAVRKISDKRLRLISQANAGPGPARNAGAKHCSAPLIAFLDADDEWLPDFLAAGLAALDRHPDCSAYVCGYDSGKFTHYSRNTIPNFAPEAQPLPPPTDATNVNVLLDCLSSLHSSSTIVRRNIFEMFGGFYGAGRCLWGEDSYFWVKVLFNSRIFWDPTARILYHLEDSSLGYAVKARKVARPIVSESNEVAQSIPAGSRGAFRSLAGALAYQDARDIGRSGRLLKALSVRHRHGLPCARAFVGDVRRFANEVYEKLHVGER